MFNFMCRPMSGTIRYHVTQTVEIFHILNCFWSTTIRTTDGCFETFIVLLSSTFISTPQHLPVSISLPIMPYSAVSCLASSTRSSAYFTVRINFLPILKSPNRSRPSLVKVLVVWVELNRWQTVSLPNSSSNLHTSRYPLAHSYFNTLIHVQFADQSSLAPVDVSVLEDVH